MENKNSTTHSVKWNAINSLISQGTTIITGVVLMRVLDPKAFGLIGMITIFTGFLNVLKDSGLGSSLIYQKILKQIDKDTVFWFNVSFGFVLMLCFYFLSPFIALYFEEPSLNALVKVYSINFLVSSLSQTQSTLFKKQLDFKKLFKVEVIGLLLSSVLAIVAAFFDFGVWSLIVLHVSRTLIITCNIWFYSSYRPRFSFSYTILKSHFKYSFPILGTKSFNYWTRNADNFFIGSFLGTQALAYYSRAYFFVVMPIQKISSIIGNVLFPSFSKINDDKERVGLMYLRAMRLTAFLTFPLLGGLIVFAEPFIEIAFGREWLPMSKTLQILSVLSLFESVFVYTTTLFFSQGATSLNFKISVVFGVVNIIAFYFGSRYSIEMVAYLLSCIYFLFLVPKVYYATKLIDLNIKLVFINISMLLLLNFLSMLICFIAHNYLSTILFDVLNFIIGITLYILTFFLLNLVANKKQLDELIFYISNLKENKIT